MTFFTGTHRRVSSYYDYIGNVTLRSRKGEGHNKVVWEKHKKYSEKEIANMLNAAYNLGKSEAVEDVKQRIGEIK